MQYRIVAWLGMKERQIREKAVKIVLCRWEREKEIFSVTKRSERRKSRVIRMNVRDLWD